MLTVCGSKPWAEHALRVINRKEGRARSAEPLMRGTVLESHQADRTVPRSASASAASSSRAPKR
eukprot:13024150-Alexandrium_andersonii.AAC.1